MTDGLLVVGADLEGEALQTEGEAGQGLVAGTGLGDNGQLGHRTGHLSAGDLDAIGGAGLKGEGTRGGSSEATSRGGREVAGGALGWPSESRTGQHCDCAGGEQLAEGRRAGMYGGVFEPTLSTLEVPSWPAACRNKPPLIRPAPAAPSLRAQKSKFKAQTASRFRLCFALSKHARNHLSFLFLPRTASTHVAVA
jgi:hypothetical protein